MPNSTNHIEIIKSVRFEYGVIELRSDHIITYEPANGITSYTLPQLEIMLGILIEISGGIPRPYFSNNYNLKSLESEERVFISNNFRQFANAFAMTENSAITRFITHTFLQLFRPEIPIKMFKTKEEAYEWLRTFNN